MILMIVNDEITIQEESGRTLSCMLYEIDRFEKAINEITKYTSVHHESNCHLMQWTYMPHAEDCIVDNLTWRDLSWTMFYIEHYL